MDTNHKAHRLLEALCDEVYRAQEQAEDENMRAIFGDSIGTTLVVMRKDKVRVEIRKENVSRHKPHLHITHSDKIDVSISLNDFSVLAGSIDNTTKKYLLKILHPKQSQLKAIWEELNENNNSIAAQKIISNMEF